MIFEPDEKTHFRAEEIPLVRALRGESPRNVAMFVRNDVVPQGAHLARQREPAPSASSGSTARSRAYLPRGDRSPPRPSGSQEERTRTQSDPRCDPRHRMAGRTLKGHFMAVNKTFVAAFGREREADVLGFTDFDFVPDALAWAIAQTT